MNQIMNDNTAVVRVGYDPKIDTPRGEEDNSNFRKTLIAEYIIDPTRDNRDRLSIYYINGYDNGNSQIYEDWHVFAVVYKRMMLMTTETLSEANAYCEEFIRNFLGKEVVLN